MPSVASADCAITNLHFQLTPYMGGEVVVRRLVHHIARRDQGAGRALGQFGRQVAGHGHQLFVRHAIADQTPFKGRFRHDRLVRQHDLQGPGAADHLRQQVGGAHVGDQPDAGEDLDKLGRTRRHDDIAHQGKGKSGARRRAIDRRDHRHPQFAQAVHGAEIAVHDRLNFCFAFVR